MSGNIDELVNCLKELQTAEYDTQTNVLASCAQSDQVLELLYHLGTEKTEISNENKAVIGPLLEKSLKSIEIAIKRIAIKYRRRLDTQVLRTRSALQFLIDDFSDYPTKTSVKKFSEFFSGIKEFIEILDDLIFRWKGRKDPENPDSDRDEAEGLPYSHTWWQD